MISAVLFDFDGVVVDSETEKFRILSELLEPYEVYLTDADYPRFLGMKTRAFLARDTRLDERTISNIERAWRSRRRTIKAFPQTVRIFACLRERGVRIGIVTGSSADVVRASGIGAVDVLVSGDDAPSKPAPDGYLLAVSTLGVDPDEVLVVEDSAAGVESARRAGLRVISVGTGALDTERDVPDHDALERYFCGDIPL